MQSKSLMLKSALISAVLAALQSAAAVAAGPTSPANATEAPIVVVGDEHLVNETGDTNNVDQAAQSEVDTGTNNDDATDANNDAIDANDGAHAAVDGQQNAVDSVQGQQDEFHNHSDPDGA